MMRNLSLLAGLVLSAAAQAQAPPFRFVKDLIPGNALPVVGLADFDLDGDLDLLTNGSGVYLNDGNAWFTPHPVFSNVRANVFDYVPIPKPVVAIGDLNADGFPDVLAWRGTLDKWVNQGNGALVVVSTVVTTTVAVVRSIALGDVDGDGDLDAVLALSLTTGIWNTAAAPLQIWLNDGAGNFTNAPALAPAQPLMPAELALRDFDADGDLDLFVGGCSAANLAQYTLISPTLIFVNAGAGSFSVGVPVPVSPSLDVYAIGDVNGDGLPDIAADAAPAPLDCTATSLPQVLINQGNLSFIAMPSTVTGLPRAVPHLVDLDANGPADLLRSGYDGVSVHLLSSGVLGPPTLTASLFGAPHSAVDTTYANISMVESATGDVDGDGDVDLVISTRQGNQILFNDSAAQPVSVPDSLAGRPGSTFGGYPGVGDVEGDGDIDLMLGAYACNTAATAPVMRIAINDGAGNLTEGTPFPCPACPVIYETTWVFFDADQDGDLDADAFSFPSGISPMHQILLNSGGAYVAGQTVLIQTNLSSAVLRTVDLDGDGDLDIVDAMNANAPRPGHVLLNDGSGGFPLVTMLPWHATRDLEIADIDGDGDLDILEAGVPSSVALLNDGLGGFTPSTTFPSMLASSVEAADLDGDGDVDVVLNDVVFLNNGVGSFSAAGALTQLPSGQLNGLFPQFALLDADGDSDVDFVGWWGLLRRNQGNATFAAAETLPLPMTYAKPILHADFDRDGDEDLVARGPSILTNMRRQLSRGVPARPGRLGTLELGGLPGASWFLFASPGTGNLPLPPFGTVFLDLATTLLVASGTFSPSGAATVSGFAPTGPGVVGLTLYWQAAMVEPQGLRLSGLEVTTIAGY